ncbi:hypothetical protein Hanom_Chr00s000001g01598051 [Helianthus anomalus]
MINIFTNHKQKTMFSHQHTHLQCFSGDGSTNGFFSTSTPTSFSDSGSGSPTMAASSGSMMTALLDLKERWMIREREWWFDDTSGSGSPTRVAFSGVGSLTTTTSFGSPTTVWDIGF